MDKLADEIKNGTFGLSGYTEMLVTDGPKIRKVQSVSLYERIGVNAIMNIVEAHIFRKYIRTTNASIKNRGLHDLLNYIRKDLKEHPSNEGIVILVSWLISNHMEPFFDSKYYRNLQPELKTILDELHEADRAAH